MCSRSAICHAVVSIITVTPCTQDWCFDSGDADSAEQRRCSTSNAPSKRLAWHLNLTRYLNPDAHLSRALLEALEDCALVSPASDDGFGTRRLKKEKLYRIFCHSIRNSTPTSAGPNLSLPCHQRNAKSATDAKGQESER